MNHLPLHRQLQRFERAGVTIAQYRINDWVKAVLVQLSALYEEHKRQVLQSRYLHADETVLCILIALKNQGAASIGKSATSLHRFCENNHHWWDYRNFKKLMDKLIATNYVEQAGPRYCLTTNSMLLLGSIERQMQKLSAV